jgi:hypothetical protein
MASRLPPCPVTCCKSAAGAARPVEAPVWTSRLTQTTVASECRCPKQAVLDRLAASSCHPKESQVSPAQHSHMCTPDDCVPLLWPYYAAVGLCAHQASACPCFLPHDLHHQRRSCLLVAHVSVQVAMCAACFLLGSTPRCWSLVLIRRLMCSPTLPCRSGVQEWPMPVHHPQRGSVLRHMHRHQDGCQQLWRVRGGVHLR